MAATPNELFAETPDRFAAVQQEAAEMLAGSVRTYPADPAGARLASVMVRALRASYVIELGGGNGYTGLHIVSAFGRTGRLEIIEPDASLARRAEHHMAEFGYTDRVHVRASDVRSSLRGQNGPVDLIIAATPPDQMAPLLPDMMRLVRTGGCVVAIGPGGEEGHDGWGTFLREVETDVRTLLYVPASMELALVTRVS